MGIELPGWLTEPLSWITLEWPHADETKLFEAGQAWISFATAAMPVGQDATSAAQSVWSSNEGPQVDAFQQWWNDEDGPSQRLSEDAIAAMIIGAALILFAAVTLAMKIAWIVALIALAIQVASAIAASFATFGAASASIPGFIAVCRQICMKALRHVIDDVIKKSIKNLLDKAKKLLKKVATRRAAKQAAKRDAKIMDQIAESLRKVNPKFREGREWQINCTNCTTAHELRRRGLDVRSSKAPPHTFPTGGRSPGEVERLWGRKFTHGGEKDINDAFSEPGSRGFVGVHWPDPNSPGNTTGGHIFNVENVGGHLRYTDAQTGQMDASQHIQNGVNHQYMRTDDLPTPDMNELYPGWVTKAMD